jgi:hypothetical protein
MIEPKYRQRFDYHFMRVPIGAAEILSGVFDASFAHALARTAVTGWPAGGLAVPVECRLTTSLTQIPPQATASTPPLSAAR